MESNTNSQGELRQYLERVLPDARLTSATVDSGYEPLLLMKTTYVMAAFAFSNGDTDSSYKVLYTGFKNYYFAQSDRPDELDIAFVLCVRPNAPNLDMLSSRVETDVYFCRKFVVRLISPLNSSLARLPFLPLSPLDAPSLRPPSAQTFLRNSGVSATLAKYLVVQHVRSPERIVTDCLSGILGEPVKVAPTPSDPIEVVERDTRRAYLKNIRIKGFRAYRKSQTFQLGSDVTVLYGPNGFGKTSLFDAIDFAVTGNIGRIKSFNDAHFRKIAKHLDCGIKDSVVTLSFSSKGDIREIERQVANRKFAKLDGNTTNRKAILAELTNGEFASTDRVDNFVSLFRATHLFSQEHQELMKGFHPNCELSEHIVSRLLAFEDYANAANKIARVRDTLLSKVNQDNREIRGLSQQIVEETEEIERLSHTGEIFSDSEELRNVINSLRDEITATGINVGTDGAELAVVQRWRTVIEVRRAAVQARIDRLTAIARDAAERPRVVTKVARIRKSIEEVETALQEVRNKEIAVLEKLRQAEVRLEELSARQRSNILRRDVLAWVSETRSLYMSLLKRERRIVGRLKLANSIIEEKKELEQILTKDLLVNNSHKLRAKQELETNLSDLGTLEVLKETAKSWQVWKRKMDELEKSERSTRVSLVALDAQAVDFSGKLDSVLATEARLVDQISELEKGQSEVRRMLLELKGRVRSGKCLLCGENYGSTEELLRRVDEQLKVDAVSSTRFELTGVRANVKSLSENLAVIKKEQAASKVALENIANKRSRLVAQVKELEEAVRKTGINIETSMVAQLQERLEMRQSTVTRLTQEISKLNESGETLQAKLTPVRSEISQAIASKSELGAEMDAVQGELKRLRHDQRAATVSLDIDIEQLKKLQELNANDTVSLSAELGSVDTAIAKLKQRAAALGRESVNRENELANLRKQVAELDHVVAGLTASLQEAKLAVDVTEETVRSLIAAESKTRAELVMLGDRVVRLEQAIDRATTAAALAQLRQNVQEKQALVTQTKQKIELHQKWLEYFEVIANLISLQRRKATKNFTREYGPRTSVVQRRLRSVYGFDEVEIQSHESAIRVRVKRRGEELRPTDYFSQSQQQTLLLGLFLTTCISQTWSSLSSILLDDPITHFDNLNSYAFLDLIAGLVDLESEGHQFILSTCDEKFFQLSRQRFGHLGKRATFYTFSAIDDDGPVVERLPSGDLASSYA